MSTTLGFRFLAGRYHAAPWGTHVNEAAVEWPPSPWRILRALVAVWHLKVRPEEVSEQSLGRVIEALAMGPPHYWLPPATPGHTRHFVPIRKGSVETTTLIFDSFLRVATGEELLVSWPTVSLPVAESTALSLLLNRMGYLGRAESWVEARLIADWNGDANCAPVSTDDGQPERGIGSVAVYGPRPPAEYAEWREDEVRTRGLDRPGLPARAQRLLSSLPEDLLGALRLDTAVVRGEGWSRPPGMASWPYRIEASLSSPEMIGAQDPMSPTVTTVRLALHGKPLPRIEDAMKIGEVVRAGAMKSADRFSEGKVPGVLSGHGLGDGNRHAHAFYLSEANEGGRIEHVLAHADGRFDPLSLRALAGLDRIWLGPGREWNVAMEQYGPASDFAGHPMLDAGTTWISRTPYLHPWHRKRSFTIEDQIRRECRERGLAEPEVESIPTITFNGRLRRPVHFHRFRTRGRRRATQPDRAGSFWRLRFPTPVHGPIALGFGCHFGLGLFERDG